MYWIYKVFKIPSGFHLHAWMMINGYLAYNTHDIIIKNKHVEHIKFIFNLPLILAENFKSLLLLYKVNLDFYE